MAKRQSLLEILKSNDLYDLRIILGEHHLDLDTLKNDIKLGEAQSLCNSLGFSKKEAQQFLKLMGIIHGTHLEPNQNNRNMTMKLALIGDSAVGKTCLMNRYINGVYSASTKSTIGTDFALCEETLSDDTNMRIQIWDTAGQERFRSISQTYYRHADAVVVCFDVTRPVTYQHCRSWSREIENYGTSDVTVIFAGCKADESVASRVSVEEKAQEIMDQYGKLYCECSAKTGENVRNVFLTACELVMQRKRYNQNDTNVNLVNILRDTNNRRNGCEC
eukprot:118560_1